MFCSKVVSVFLVLAVVKVHGGGLAAVAPVARLSTPLLTNEVLTASAPALFRSAPVVAAAPLAAPVAAPLLAPATIGYRTAIPQNIPPFAAQTNIVNRALSGYYAYPFSAALTAPVATPFAAPLATPFAAPLAAPFATAFSAPVAASFAAPLLRSPLAFATSPVVSSLPLVRSGFAAPLGLRAAAVPLQTQAIFGPAPVAAELAPAGVTTKLSPVEEPAAEDIPQNDEDQANLRGALEPNVENPSDDFNRGVEEQSVADINGPEEQPSN